MKSWFGLEMAVSVASGTPCLERFPAKDAGPALVFLAEDALPNVRDRIEGLCQRRKRRIDDLDLFVITEPVLRLDDEACRERLERTVERYAPKLLLLDPLIRLHRLSENDSQEISGLLGHLRELQRRHGVSIVLVHHASKRQRSHPGQSLRGSSDLHAWTDTTAILVRKEDRVVLTLEHRFAAAPAPLVLTLATDNGATGLAVVEDARVPGNDAADLPDAVIGALRSADQPLRRGEIRDRLRVNNRRLGEALTELERSGLLRRGPDGWTATNGNSARAGELFATGTG